MAQKPVLGKGLASLFPGAAPKAAEKAPGELPPQFTAEAAAQVASATPAPATSSTATAAAPQAVPQATPTTGTGAVAAGAPASATNGLDPSNRDRIPGITMAYIEDIVANEYQPRRDFDETALKELSQSIRANGIIQPLVVRKTLQGYQLIAGERRLRASKLAGLKQVPIVIRKSTDREALELALIENVQRQNLNCIDEALAYFQLVNDFNLTQEETAQRVGKERATVANHLRLLKLPEPIIDDLKRQILSFGHGKVLLSLEDTDLRLRARQQIVERRLSVRDAEQLVEQLKRGAALDQSKPAPTPAQNPVQSRLAALAQNLTRAWSSRVEIKGSERRGKIVLHYASRQDLERILAAMQK